MSDSIIPIVPTGYARPAPAAFAGLARQISRDWKGPGLTIALPGGASVTLGDAHGPRPACFLRIRDYRALRRAAASGDIGFAEGYMAGEWDTPDLAGLLTVLADNFDALRGLSVGAPLGRLLNTAANLFRLNTVRGSRRNIHAHYDLGNAFYGAWLDPSMTYSSALYRDPDVSLAAAQTEKYAALARAIGVGPNDHVLEIGCGWGGFADYVAKEIGARVTGLTISQAQFEFARARIARSGLAERVDIRLCDYRKIEGQFDHVASIEMFEAVGEAYWPTYFDAVRARLKPGGRAGLQIITIRDDLFPRYRKRVDFIQKLVFPGGMLPGETVLRREIERAGLSWTEAPLRFGPDYARTLKEWAIRFEAAWPDLVHQGFDERFRRLWRFYLAYCEAGFATGRTDVLQLVAQRP